MGDDGDSNMGFSMSPSANDLMANLAHEGADSLMQMASGVDVSLGDPLEPGEILNSLGITGGGKAKIKQEPPAPKAPHTSSKVSSLFGDDEPDLKPDVKPHARGNEIKPHASGSSSSAAMMGRQNVKVKEERKSKSVFSPPTSSSNAVSNTSSEISRLLASSIDDKNAVKKSPSFHVTKNEPPFASSSSAPKPLSLPTSIPLSVAEGAAASSSSKTAETEEERRKREHKEKKKKKKEKKEKKEKRREEEASASGGERKHKHKHKDKDREKHTSSAGSRHSNGGSPGLSSPHQGPIKLKIKPMPGPEEAVKMELNFGGGQDKMSRVMGTDPSVENAYLSSRVQQH